LGAYRSLGAETVGFFDAHGGANPILPRLVTASGDNAPLLGQRTNDERLARELRVIADLRNREEHIHVDVYDFHT